MSSTERDQFIVALESGDVQRLRELLTEFPSARSMINEPIGGFGSRPVQIAAKHRAALDVLIDFGADINLRSDWEKGPFGVLDSCDEETARHLITRGAILTAHAAARLGWLDELAAIVDANPAVVHELGGDGQRPLHFAKTIEIADFLLLRGAQIDARCVDHRSTAAQYMLVDRTDICRHLLSRGATPDIFMAAALGDASLAQKLIDDNPSCLSARIHLDGYAPVPKLHIYCWTLGWYRSPQLVARNFGHGSLYESLMAQSTPVARLFVMISQNDFDGAKRMFAEHPNLFESLRIQDQQMLVLAAFHGREESAMMMLRLGFDPHVKGPDGETALHAAAWSGSVRVVEALLKIDAADLNATEPQFNATPLGWARHGSTNCHREGAQHAEVIARLLEAGAM